LEAVLDGRAQVGEEAGDVRALEVDVGHVERLVEQDRGCPPGALLLSETERAELNRLLLKMLRLPA
jgi:hypothetical protein